MPDGTQPVEVYDPKGQFGVIPASQLEQAKAAGYKPKADYVEVVHPKTGQRGIVPKDQWGDDKKPGIAQTQGYVMSPREQQRVKAKAGTNVQPIAEGPTPSSIVPAQGGGAHLMQAPNPSIQEFQKGQAAGSKQAMVDIGAGALGGLFTSSAITKAGPAVPAGRDALGRFLPWAASKVTAEGPSVARQGVSKVVSGAKSVAAWLKENPVKALAVETFAHEMGVDPIQLAHKVIGLAGGKTTHVP
jgi:hypothetical protein